MYFCNIRFFAPFSYNSEYNNGGYIYMSGEDSKISIFSLCMWGVFLISITKGSSIVIVVLLAIGIVHAVKEV